MRVRLGVVTASSEPSGARNRLRRRASAPRGGGPSRARAQAVLVGENLRALLSLLLLVVAGLAAAAAVPARVEITYRVSVGPLKIGEGRDVLQHDGKTYKVVSESKTAGIASIVYPLDMVRQSVGRVTAEGLRPDTFQEMRNGKVKRRVQFDWEKKQALLYDGRTEQTVPLPERTWDETSFGYNFAFSEREPASQQVNLTDGRRITLYEYAIVGSEKLKTAIGSVDTVHVQKLQAPGSKGAFDTWIAPAYYNLPVKTRIKERGGTVFDWEVVKIDYSAR